MFKHLFKKIKQGFKDLFNITGDELRNIFKDEGVLIIFFAAALLYPILYSFVYKNEAYHEAPVCIVDESNSALSREYIRRLDATPELRVKDKCASMDEARQKYNNKEVVGIIFIPHNFSINIANNKQANVLVYTNMSSMMFYKSLYAGSNYVSLEMGHDIQMNKLGQLGITGKQAEVSAMPILSQGHALYNPKDGFSSFLLPPVLILIIQQTLILGIGILAGTAREENSLKQLVPLQRKYHGTLRIVLGKSTAYLLIYIINSFFVLYLIPRMFKLPHLGNPLDLTLFLLPFILATIFFAITISVFFRNRETPFILFLFTSLIFLFMSGYAWPPSHISPFWKAISYLIPSTPGISGYQKINSMGATLSQVTPEFFLLWLQTGVYFISACFVYARQIRASKKAVMLQMEQSNIG